MCDLFSCVFAVVILRFIGQTAVIRVALSWLSLVVLSLLSSSSSKFLIINLLSPLCFYPPYKFKGFCKCTVNTQGFVWKFFFMRYI